VAYGECYDSVDANRTHSCFAGYRAESSRRGDSSFAGLRETVDGGKQVDDPPGVRCGAGSVEANLERRCSKGNGERRKEAMGRDQGREGTESVREGENGNS
jgi:hypothetical protein